MSNILAHTRDLSELPQNWDWSYLIGMVSSDFAKTRELLSGAGVTAEALQSISVRSNRPEESYGRKILFQDRNFEVLLATWSYGAECAPHDHGFSNGVVWLVDGDFQETHYELEKNLSVLGKPVLHPAGALLSVTPGDIHSMTALNGGISLHIYTPAIHDMKVFDASARRTLIVSDDCGAWVPTRMDQIVAQEEWL